jgi:hypothetical protein
MNNKERKVAKGIAKVINKVHGIDNPKPLVEGVDYTTGTGEEIKKSENTPVKKKEPEKPNEHLIWDLLEEGKFEEALKLVGNNLSLLSPDQREIIDEWRKIEQEKRRQEIRQEIMQKHGVSEEDVQRRDSILAQRAQLEQMGKNFASGSGPIVSNILSGKEKKSDANDKISSVSKNNTKDPEYTKLHAGTVRRLRKNDSEADVLAKMFNLAKRDYDEHKKENTLGKKYKKEFDKQKEKENDELITLFTGKTKKKLPAKYRLPAGQKGLLKYGVMGLVAVGGFMVTKKAFANINLKQLFEDINKSFFSDNKLTESEGKASVISLVGQPNSKSREDAFLSVIKKYEAGKAGYYAINRKTAGDTPGGMLGLEKMKVKDVMQLQKEKKIFAAGAYQITPDTLKDVYAGMKLTGEEVFDEEMQDKMGKYLIRTRVKSFSEFQKTGDKNLIPKIINETNSVWAVFVDEATGQSKHEGGAGKNKGFKQANEELKSTALATNPPAEEKRISSTKTTKNSIIAVGDSLGVGINAALGIKKEDLTNLSEGGIGPEDVLKKINAIEKDNPGFFKGKQVIVSSGAPNRPNKTFNDKEASLVTQEIELLKKLGATPALLGVGPGDPSGKSGKKIDESGINEKLQKIAQDTMVPFIDIKSMFDAKQFDAMGLHLGGSGYKQIIDTVKFLLDDKNLSLLQPDLRIDDSTYLDNQRAKQTMMASRKPSIITNSTNIFNAGDANLITNEYQISWSAFAQKQFNLSVG